MIIKPIEERIREMLWSIHRVPDCDGYASRMVGMIKEREALANDMMVVKHTTSRHSKYRKYDDLNRRIIAEIEKHGEFFETSEYNLAEKCFGEVVREGIEISNRRKNKRKKIEKKITKKN